MLAVTAAVAALSLVAAGPAPAATTITRATVVSSLLTATQLGAGWHRYDDRDSGATPEVTGCAGTAYQTVGLRFTAKRSFQYAEAPSFVQETVGSFRSRDAARSDFAKGVRQFTACTSFTIDGKVFTVKRLSMPTFADQRVMFLIAGSVATAAGDVPFTVWLVVTRWGRQQTATTVMVAGTLTSDDRRALKASAVRVARAATGKVATLLGR